jgi:hypothetical protein
MSIAVDLVIMGLVAIVPDAQQKQVTVLVPDIAQSYYASDGTEIPVHKPVLAYDCTATSSGACTPADQAMPAFGDLFDTWSDLVPDLNKYGVRDLEGYQIELLNAQKPTTVTYQTGEIADFSCAAPAAGRLDQHFVGTLKPEYAKLLAARTVLPAAFIAPKQWVGNQSIKWQFAPILDITSKTCTATPIAEKTVITTSVSSATAMLKLSSLQNGSPVETITLKPDAHNRVTVYLSDMAFCPKWYLKTAGAKKRACREKLDAHFGSPHFEVYYEFSATRPPVRLRPVPVPASADFNLDDRPICPQGQLKP